MSALAAAAATIGLTLAGFGGVVPAGGAVVGDPTVNMTIDNFGQPVSLQDPDQLAWAHLTANAAPITVTVTVQPGVEAIRGYFVTLSAPDAFQGPKVQGCTDQSHTFDVPVQCQFVVPVSRGENRIDVEFHSFGAPALEVHGFIYGGELEVSAHLQVLDERSIWRTMSDAGFAVPGERRSSVRYVIVNTGDIPFRPTDACRDTLLQPGAFLACTLRSPRPAYALAGTYAVPLNLDDPAGGVAARLVTGRVTTPGFSFGPNGAGQSDR